MWIFFRTYKKAPLATCVSYLATIFYILTVFFSVGYFMDWEGLRDSGTSPGEALGIAAFMAVMGVVCWKLAAYLAKRKQMKLDAAAASGVSGKSSVGPSKLNAARYCPKCGAKHGPGDVFCAKCGTKL